MPSEIGILIGLIDWAAPVARKTPRYAATSKRVTPMTFKANYRQQRSERSRIQNERRQEKLQKRQSVVKRKAEPEERAAADESAKQG